MQTIKKVWIEWLQGHNMNLISLYADTILSKKDKTEKWIQGKSILIENPQETLP